MLVLIATQAARNMQDTAISLCKLAHASYRRGDLEKNMVADHVCFVVAVLGQHPYSICSVLWYRMVLQVQSMLNLAEHPLLCKMLPCTFRAEG